MIMTPAHVQQMTVIKDQIKDDQLRSGIVLHYGGAFVLTYVRRRAYVHVGFYIYFFSTVGTNTPSHCILRMHDGKDQHKVQWKDNNITTTHHKGANFYHHTSQETNMQMFQATIQ